MNTRHLIIAAIAAVALAAPSLSFAGKKNKAAAPAPPKPNPVMLKYDKNADGTLDDAEKEAITSTFAELAAWDKDKDGKISAEELAEIAKPPAPPVETPKKKKKKNK